MFSVSKPALLLLTLAFTWTQISFRLQIGAFFLEKRLTLCLRNVVLLWHFPVKQDSSDLRSTRMHCSCSIDDEVIISHREKNMVNLELSRIAPEVLPVKMVIFVFSSPLPEYQEGQNATEPFPTSQDDGNYTLVECPPGFQWCHLTNLCSSVNNCCNAMECTNSSFASSPIPASPQHKGSQLSYELVKEFLFTIPAGPSAPYLVSFY